MDLDVFRRISKKLQQYDGIDLTKFNFEKVWKIFGKSFPK